LHAYIIPQHRIRIDQPGELAALCANGQNDSPACFYNKVVKSSQQLEHLILKKILQDFVRHVANSRIKIDILQYFNGRSADSRRGAPFASTAELAGKIHQDLPAVQSAVQELRAAGVISYGPAFGDDDLCYVNDKLHTPEIMHGLAALFSALASNPQDIDACLHERFKRY